MNSFNPPIPFAVDHQNAPAYWHVDILSFRVDSEVAHILNLYVPAGFEQTVVELGQPAPTRTLPPKGVDKPVDPEQVRALFQRIGMHPSDQPDTLRAS